MPRFPRFILAAKRFIHAVVGDITSHKHPQMARPSYFSAMSSLHFMGVRIDGARPLPIIWSWIQPVALRDLCKRLERRPQPINLGIELPYFLWRVSVGHRTSFGFSLSRTMRRSSFAIASGIGAPLA